MSTYREMRQNCGFSLIELMVVIAIVAILAAVALPYYKSYLITSRLATVVPAIQRLVSDSITYHSIHGRLPNAYDLHLSTTVGSATADEDIAAQIIGPYYIQNSSTGMPGVDGVMGYQGLNLQPFDSASCDFSNVSSIWVYLDAEKIGFDSNVATTLATGYNGSGGVCLNCVVGSHNGIYESTCQYCYGTQTVSGLDEGLIPGWQNQNQTNAWDLGNFYDWPGLTYCE